MAKKYNIGQAPSPLDPIVQDAKDFRDHAEERWDANWKAMREDLEFLGGAQWPTEVLSARNREMRPCLTLNRLPQFVDQVIGDSRQNQISLRAVPAGDDRIDHPTVSYFIRRG